MAPRTELRIPSNCTNPIPRFLQPDVTRCPYERRASSLPASCCRCCRSSCFRPASLVAAGWSTILGAGMIVGMMMLIYFGLQGMGSLTGKDDGGDDAVALSDADMSALKTLF